MTIPMWKSTYDRSFFRLVSVQETVCNPAQCSPVPGGGDDVIGRLQDGSHQARSRGKTRDLIRDPNQGLVRDYAVPFRGDVERIRPLCSDDDVTTDPATATRSGNRFQLETICKNYTPRNCDPDFGDCRTKEICYKKPRLARSTSEDAIRVNCREKRLASNEPAVIVRGTIILPYQRLLIRGCQEDLDPLKSVIRKGSRIESYFACELLSRSQGFVYLLVSNILLLGFFWFFWHAIRLVFLPAFCCP